MSAIDVEQLAQMRAGVDYRFVISIRGFKLAVRPLSIIETVRIAADVTEKLQDIPEIMRATITQHTLLAKETIKMASTSDVGSNDPKITDYILDRMTPDEMNTLFREYLHHCDRVNPSLEKMSREDLAALVTALKKNVKSPEELDLQLIGLSVLQLHNMAHYLLSISGD